MINFFKWSDAVHEIIMEGNSYYFLHKMCVAFRGKGNPVVYARNTYSNKRHHPIEVSNFFIGLSHSSELQYLKCKEFDCALNATYSKGLFRGARQVGFDRFFSHQDKNDPFEDINKHLDLIIKEKKCL